MDRGISEGQKGNESGALHYFLLALKENPNDPGVLNNVAVSEMRQGKIKDSRSRLEHSIDLDPFGDSATFNMWECERQEQKAMVDLDEAKREAEEGLQRIPLAPLARIRAADIYLPQYKDYLEGRESFILTDIGLPLPHKNITATSLARWFGKANTAERRIRALAAQNEQVRAGTIRPGDETKPISDTGLYPHGLDRTLAQAFDMPLVEAVKRLLKRVGRWERELFPQQKRFRMIRAAQQRARAGNATEQDRRILSLFHEDDPGRGPGAGARLRTPYAFYRPPRALWDELRGHTGMDWEGEGDVEEGRVQGRHVIPPLFRSDRFWLEGGFSSQALMEEFLDITRWDMVTMGAPGAGINFHWDAIHSGSWQLQLAGVKRWVICPANQTALLYQVGEVDMFRPDYKKYPLVQRASCAWADLMPGELLYYPKGYWHQTKGGIPRIVDPSRGRDPRSEPEDWDGLDLAMSGSVVTGDNWQMLAYVLRRECDGTGNQMGHSELLSKPSKALCEDMEKHLFPWWQAAFTGEMAPLRGRTSVGRRKRGQAEVGGDPKVGVGVGVGVLGVPPESPLWRGAMGQSSRPPGAGVLGGGPGKGEGPVHLQEETGRW